MSVSDARSRRRSRSREFEITARSGKFSLTGDAFRDGVGVGQLITSSDGSGELLLEDSRDTSRELPSADGLISSVSAGDDEAAVADCFFSCWICQKGLDFASSRRPEVARDNLNGDLRGDFRGASSSLCTSSFLTTEDAQPISVDGQCRRAPACLDR